MECVHGLSVDTCQYCSPARPATTLASSGPKTYVWIMTTRLYHEMDCFEATWDPAQAKHPGERRVLSVAETRDLLEKGDLERGCLGCGANAYTVAVE